MSHFIFAQITFEKLSHLHFTFGSSPSVERHEGAWVFSKVGGGRVTAAGVTAGRWECQGGDGDRLQVGVSGRSG